jgi:predicted translin family RNA/ssDNA-binding protein
MKEDQFNLDETTLSIDLSDATQAVKESRFEDALNLLKVLLKEHPNHIDILYLSAVSTRFLKKFDDSRKHIEHLTFQCSRYGSRLSRARPFK